MLDDTVLERVLNSFTALARSGRLFSIDKLDLERRDRARYAIDCPPHGQPCLSIDVHKYNRFLKMLDAAYSGKLSDGEIRDFTRGTVRSLVTSIGADLRPEDAKSDFLRGLSGLEDAIDDLTLMLQVDGLTMTASNSVPLGSLRLHPHKPGTDYARILHAEQELAGRRETSAPPYFQYQGCGHIDRLVSIASQEADTALSIFRLFNAQWPRDRCPLVGYPKRIGILRASTRDVRRVYVINNDDQNASTQMTPQHYDPFFLDDDSIDRMNRSGLNTINALVCDPAYDDSDKAIRVRRAVHWFAKGTDAESLADSFLMYAIAAEALLSEGRTSQETYAQRMAGLLARDVQYRVGPFWGQLSSPQDMTDPNEWFAVFQDRLIELFDFRNRIAHGLETRGEAEQIGRLVDFEAFTRGAILSFALGPWQDITEYAGWLDSSLTLLFHPSL